jgi:hypothetical protein
MNIKPTIVAASVEPQPEMSEPTRSIVRCCELRKRKAAETQLIILRLRSQAGSTTVR